MNEKQDFICEESRETALSENEDGDVDNREDIYQLSTSKSSK